jgi:hypothetical protein
VRVVVGIVGAVLVVAILAEFFVTFVLPRRVKRDPRIARQLYGLLWKPWRWFAAKLSPTAGDTMLGFFGPLGLLFQLAVWTFGLILGFACLQWANGSDLGPHAHFGDDFYFSAGGFLSATTELTPQGSGAKALFLMEAASAVAVLFIVIGYLPSFYQAFSRREISVSQLDARAGSPPTPGALLVRSRRCQSWADLDRYLAEWERWTAELMETQLAYPILAYFRSQHVNQNWLSALTTILDAAAFRVAAAADEWPESAELTLAIGRHAVSDFSYGLRAPPQPPEPDRLDESTFERLYGLFADTPITLPDPVSMRAQLDELRMKYEPYAEGLARKLALQLPPWLPPEDAMAQWRAPSFEEGRRARVLP